MEAMAPLYASMAVSSASALATGYAESRALKAKGDYEQSIANTNAAMADLAGTQTLEAGDIAAGRKDLETKQKVGTELATQGASGVDVGSGSAALVRNATNFVGRIDELTIRNNAARTAWGYKVQGIQDRFRGKFAQLTAKSEAQQSLLSGGLGAVERPLAIYADYKMLSRRSGMGGTSNIPDSYIPTADAGDEA